MKIPVSIGMILALGCSSGGNNDETPKATSLVYTDPPAEPETFRLVQDNGLGSSSGIVLALVGSPQQVRGLAFVYQLDPNLGPMLIPMQLNNAVRTFNGGGQYGIFAFQNTTFDAGKPVVAFSLTAPKSGAIQQPQINGLVVVCADGTKKAYPMRIGRLEVK
jgi:hypothetical protein